MKDIKQIRDRVKEIIDSASDTPNMTNDDLVTKLTIMVMQELQAQTFEVEKWLSTMSLKELTTYRDELRASAESRLQIASFIDKALEGL
jgi:hypothetical protein